MTITDAGAFVQVSRLGSPLVNEVVVPMQFKDFFNSQPPVKDGPNGFGPYVANPILMNLLPVLYPTAFPKLAAFIRSGAPRADLEAIFLTGIPAGVIPGFDGTSPGKGSVAAEMLRLNMGYAPTGTNGGGTSIYGLLGGDVAGYPNGRRVTDDVVTIELLAVAGATLPFTDKNFTPDAVVTTKKPSITDAAPPNPMAYKNVFPYLADPYPGFSNPTGTPSSNHNNSLNYTPTS